MKKVIKQIIFLTVLTAVLSFPYFVFADSPLDRLESLGTDAGFQPLTDQNSLPYLAGLLVRTIISLLGIVFIGLTIYGGYNWMTASGDESKLTRAKDTLRRAIIGLIILVSSFSFWVFLKTIIFGNPN